VTGGHGEARGSPLGLGRVEALVAELADGPAIKRVPPGRTPLLEIEQSGSVADLLVRHEGEGEGGMRDGGVCLESGEQAHDLGITRLVIATQEARAVGRDDVPSDHVVEGRVVRRRGRDLLTVDDAHDELAPLVMDDVGMDRSALDLPGRVYVPAESQAGKVLTALARRPMGRHVGVIVHLHVHGTQLAQVAGDDVGDVELALRRGHLARPERIGLGLDLAVSDEAVDHVTHANVPFCRNRHAASDSSAVFPARVPMPPEPRRRDGPRRLAYAARR